MTDFPKSKSTNRLTAAMKANLGGAGHIGHMTGALLSVSNLVSVCIDYLNNYE
jgi:hypothetical protein